MKKMKNLVTVSGYVYDFGSEKMGLAAKVSKKGVNYIGGDINISVDADNSNIIPVHFSYVAPTFATKGTPNPNYNVLLNLLNSGKTVVRDGAAATFVTITGSISTNDYIGQDGMRHEAKRIEGSRVTVKAPDAMSANFDGDMLITKIVRKEASEENGQTEDVLLVSGNYWDFRNNMVPVTMECRDPALMEGLESITGELPYAEVVKGFIKHARVVTNVMVPGLGNTVHVDQRVTYDNRWEIVHVGVNNYYGEGVTEEEVSAAVQAREIHWAEVEKQRAEYNASLSAKTPAQPAASSMSAVRAAALASDMGDF